MLWLWWTGSPELGWIPNFFPYQKGIEFLKIEFQTARIPLFHQFLAVEWDSWLTGAASDTKMNDSFPKTPSSPFSFSSFFGQERTQTSPCFFYFHFWVAGHVKKERKRSNQEAVPYTSTSKKKRCLYFGVCHQTSLVLRFPRSFLRFAFAETLDDLHLLFAPDPEAATSAAERRRQLGLKMQGRERAMVCQVCLNQGDNGMGCTPAPV